MSDMPESVSLSEVWDFIYKNYKYNIYVNGISKLCSMFPKVLDDSYNKYYLRGMEISGKEIAGNDCVEIYMKYGYNSVSYTKTLILCKKDDSIYFLSRGFSFNDEKAILSKIDFSKLYDFCMKNNFNSSECFHCKAKYNNKNQIIDIPITISCEGIEIGDNHCYSVKKFVEVCNYGIEQRSKESFPRNLYSSCSSSDSFRCMSGEYKKSDILEIKHSYINDPYFLDNIEVKFEDLPDFIKDSIYSNNFEEFENKCITGRIKSLFKKKRKS